MVFWLSREIQLFGRFPRTIFSFNLAYLTNFLYKGHWQYTFMTVCSLEFHTRQTSIEVNAKTIEFYQNTRLRGESQKCTSVHHYWTVALSPLPVRGRRKNSRHCMSYKWALVAQIPCHQSSLLAAICKTFLLQQSAYILCSEEWINVPLQWCMLESWRKRSPFNRLNNRKTHTPPHIVYMTFPTRRLFLFRKRNGIILFYLFNL